MTKTKSHVTKMMKHWSHDLTKIEIAFEISCDDVDSLVIVVITRTVDITKLSFFLYLQNRMATI